MRTRLTGVDDDRGANGEHSESEGRRDDAVGAGGEPEEHEDDHRQPDDDLEAGTAVVRDHDERVGWLALGHAEAEPILIDHGRVHDANFHVRDTEALHDEVEIRDDGEHIAGDLLDEAAEVSADGGRDSERVTRTDAVRGRLRKGRVALRLRDRKTCCAILPWVAVWRPPWSRRYESWQPGSSVKTWRAALGMRSSSTLSS
ncbi:MAG: hypothetical protein OXE02_04545 [Chloroflexi bacterium]|nr:hypothetical protein [Chloroflexota bacterium]